MRGKGKITVLEMLHAKKNMFLCCLHDYLSTNLMHCIIDVFYVFTTGYIKVQVRALNFYQRGGRGFFLIIAAEFFKNNTMTVYLCLRKDLSNR